MTLIKKSQLAILLLAALTAVGCAPANTAVENGEGLPAIEDVEDTLSAGDAEPAVFLLEGSTVSQLSQEEIEGLLFMREEEKLARDVYQYLYDQWGSTVFDNIGRSEQNHMDAVLGLLERYGLDDPAGAAGEFSNSDLQALYDQLILQGSQSLEAALQVGAAIEEIDILDLLTRMEQTTQADILTVYEKLLSGSENHLRAFSRNLSKRTGETYSPQYLSQIEFDRIMSGSNGNGRKTNGRWGQS